MIVVDASVVATAFGNDDEMGERFRSAMGWQQQHAPEFVDLEVVSVWRRQQRAGMLPERRARQALADLASLKLDRWPHEPLIQRVWELRDNVSTYDAVYVALAEALQATLLTADGRLARAPGIRCKVAVVS